jgi:CRP-like cAMP-binding protein
MVEEEDIMMQIDQSLQAFIWGIISAVSLTLGALSIKFWKPGSRATGFLMSFGAGALISALTIDLVAPSIRNGNFLPLSIGCVLGGVMFELLNMLLNSKGGFLRKSSTTINYIKGKKIKQFRELFKKLSQVPLFQSLPANEIKSILPILSAGSFKSGATLCKQGDPGDSLFIIEKGIVNVIDDRQGKIIASLHKGDVMGEIAMITGEARTASLTAITDVDAWIVRREDFEKMMKESPGIASAVHNLIAGRLENLKAKKSICEEDARRWTGIASKNIDDAMSLPTDNDVRAEAESKSGAPFAIWLGNLLDSIPESLVVGATLVHSSFSLSLIAGLFISNYPEAFSSSLGMKKQGSPFWKILLMWASLTILTGIGAWAGNILLASAPEFIFAGIEGLAAGAMLTMIAETMLPEAFQKGGTITGLSTIVQFIAA